ncbi:hypothetical protein VR41_08285 [Streptomyces sp. NRRL B-1568]|nr:hypothetical protein VR41_08285 [Streptomyces sp. NRRL B-1568]
MAGAEGTGGTGSTAGGLGAGLADTMDVSRIFGALPPPRRTASRPLVEQAVRALAYEASAGLPGPWAQAVREAAGRGAEGLAEALDDVAAVAAERRAERMVRPRWWAMVAAGQGVLSALQLMGAVWLVGAAFGEFGGPWWVPGVLMVGGGAGGPLLAWCCRVAARGPARGHGQETERQLRGAAGGCGRARVLEPVAAELLRYREVRAQYVIAAGEA